MQNLFIKNYLIKRAAKHLNLGYSNRAGRNFFGRKTIFTQSGGLKFKLKVIDFRRNLVCFGLLLTIEKDLNRSGLVGAIYFENGYFTNILLSSNHNLDEPFINNYSSSMKRGCASFFYFILTGSFVHHIEIKPTMGAQMSRSAGTSSFVISKDDKLQYSFLKMNSGWLLKISNWCLGVIGVTSNQMHKFIRLEKAGKNRSLGFRPHVRGLAKNPCDHPHGGGEGRHSPPAMHRSPSGKPAKSHTKKTKLDYKRRKKFKIFKKK